MHPFRKLSFATKVFDTYPSKWVPEEPFCVTDDIVFEPFDYLVVKFKYIKPTAGIDLDIMVYYDNTGTIYDNDAVGYGQTPDEIKIPTDTTPDTDAYLWWANDDVGLPNGECVEAVVIGVNKFIMENTVSGSIIQIPLRVGWFGSIGTGLVKVYLGAYLGGTMSKVGTDIINTGGVLAGIPQTKNVTITSGTGQVTESFSDLIGTIYYDKVAKTATLK